MTLRDIKELTFGVLFWAGVVLLCGYIGLTMWFLFNGAAALVCVLLLVAVAAKVQGALAGGEG
jgi:hypothetical protein